MIEKLFMEPLLTRATPSEKRDDKDPNHNTGDQRDNDENCGYRSFIFPKA